MAEQETPVFKLPVICSAAAVDSYRETLLRKWWREWHPILAKIQTTFARQMHRESCLKALSVEGRTKG